jgi:hypothetical protein
MPREKVFEAFVFVTGVLLPAALVIAAFVCLQAWPD